MSDLAQAIREIPCPEEYHNLKALYPAREVWPAALNAAAQLVAERGAVPLYDPPPPDLSLSEQVRHARGFAAGICRDDHHVSRLLEQMARSIEVLSQPAAVAERGAVDGESYADRTPPPPGLYGRYVIAKSDGTPIDPRARYFVLRLDEYGDDQEHVAACRAAAHEWCDKSPPHLKQVADDLRATLPAQPAPDSIPATLENTDE